MSCFVKVNERYTDYSLQLIYILTALVESSIFTKTREVKEKKEYKIATIFHRIHTDILNTCIHLKITFDKQK